METKTYYAKDLSEVMEKIKAELGDDAIIIKSRRAKRGGLMGLFKSSVYEVVVSYDPEQINQKPEQKEIPINLVNPLSDFGRAAFSTNTSKTTRGNVSAMTVDAANALNAANQALFAAQRSVAFEQIAKEPPQKNDPSDFAQLIKMAGAVTEQSNTQPAWITPDAKVNAYMSMQKPVEPENIPVIKKAANEPQKYMKPSEPKPVDAPNVNVPVKRGRGRPKKQESRAVTPPAGENINSRLDVVEQMLRELMSDIRSGPATGSRPNTADDSELKIEAKRLSDCLKNQDVDEPVAHALVSSAIELSRAYGYTLQAGLERALKEVLGKPRYIRGSTKTARTVMLVGPTGVGKTTTLVKLAAGCVFERKARVAIVNADIFRVGAQDQLRAYAKILDVPIRTIYETKELKTVLNEFSSFDFVFIDTCGKASTDKNYQNEIRELLNTDKIQDTYLVVSGTTSGRLCRQIIESYSFMDEYKTILTKVDESGTVGGAVNLAFYSGQPLSYVTIGQNVPDDINKIEVDEVIKQLLREL